jgi:hypothetical protein
MACSDYLSIKKRKKSNTVKEHSGSKNTLHKQLYQIQHTTLFNEDQEIIEPTLFNINLKNVPHEKKTVNRNHHLPMYSIPRMHHPEYIKNRYEAPFCWTCITPLGEVIQNISCSVCNSLQPLSEFGDVRNNPFCDPNNIDSN